MKPQNITIFLFSIMVLIFTVSPVNCTETVSERELYNQAYNLSIQKEYQKAVEMLNRLLSLYPLTMNEDVYWKLAQIYDENLYDYQKALEVYQRYLTKFPEGRFYTNFRDRAAYLTKNQRDWDAIRDYKQISDTSYTREIKENIKMIRNLLEKYPQTAITPDIYYWLASQYQQTGQSREALTFSKKYLNTFPANGKTSNDIIIAYEQYSSILASQRQYQAAINILKETLKYQITPIEYSENLKSLQKERRLWIGLEICVFYIVLFLFLLVMVRPWREIKFKFEPVRMVKWLMFLILGTLLPMLGVFVAGYGTWKTFYGLAVISSIILVLIKLAAPVAGKLNRPLYLVICFFLIIAGIYLTFYWADNLAVFYQPAQP